MIHRQDLNILMIIGGVTLALFKRNNDFYIFDSHSRDEQGLPVPEGMSCLIEFPDIFELEKYIIVCYLELRSIESQYFQIQTIAFSVITSTVVAALQTEYRNYKRREITSLSNAKRKENFDIKIAEKRLNLITNRKKLKRILMKINGK